MNCPSIYNWKKWMFSLRKKNAIAVIETMKKLLDKKHFDDAWAKAMKISTDMKQIITSGGDLYHFKEPSLPRNSQFTVVKEYYRSVLHDDGINHAVSELEARFNNEHQDVICLLTRVVMQPNETDVEREASVISELYDTDKSSLLCERKIVATAISLNKKENVLSATYKLIK